VVIIFLVLPMAQLVAQEPIALSMADERYKADILLVVAHPDDEGRQRRILRERWTNIGAWQSFLERAGAAARTKPAPNKQQRLGGPRD